MLGWQAVARYIEMGISLVDRENESLEFNVNFWNWRPIVELIRGLEVLPDEKVGLLHDPCCGHGLSGSEADLVADALERHVLPTLDDETRVLLDGSTTQQLDDFEFHKEDVERNYSTNRAVLEKFIAFCRACSGFEVS